MKSAIRSIWTSFLLSSFVLILCTGAFAQGSGELTGLVTDTTGAVVSGVEVKLTNSATGEVRTTVTTPAGIYSFPVLPIVGTYTLEVGTKGFKISKVQNVIVSVGTTTTRDVKLEVGANTDYVTVEAGQQIVQTEDSAISQLIDRRIWEQMPLEARNSNDFLNLVAGAVPEKFDETFRGPAVNGTRTGSGNFMIEGVDNNEQGQGGVAICGLSCGQGGSNTSISPDAVEEYRVITHDFSAEYGKGGGFVTDTVLKGGTNQWHGSAFEYNRIQALAANDWFSNAAGLQDHLVRNQFGGSFGGPIIKDKTFFYSSLEFHRLRVSSPFAGAAFTQQFYDFVNTGAFETFMESDPAGFCMKNFSATCPGGFSNSATVGPIFQSLMQKFPLGMPLVDCSVSCTTPSFTGQGVYTGQAIFGIGQAITYPVPEYALATESLSAPVNQYRFSVKIDHKLSSKDQLNGVYLLENVDATTNFAGGQTTFGPPSDNPNRAQTAAITFTHTFSPTVLNQLKGGYVRHLANFTSPGTDGIPSMVTADSLAAGFGASNSFPQFFTENQFQLKDDVSITHGKHQLKFGAEYRRTRNGSSFESNKNGSFWGWGGEDLITDSTFSDQADQLYFGGPAVGSWYYAGGAVNPTNGQEPVFYRGYRANETGIYGQDDWRVNSRLTVNLGLRWEYFGPPHNFQKNIDSNFYFGNPVTPFATSSNNPFIPVNSPAYAAEATGAFQVRNSSIWNKNLKNFGPRAGFAWDILGTQKLVLRAGYGMYYDRIYNNVFENMRFNPPFYCNCTFGILQSGSPAGALETPGVFAVPFTNTAALIDPAFFPNGLPKARPRHINQDLSTPYYMQESFGLQYQVSKDMVLETNYIGTLGRKLIGIYNLNTFDGRVSCSAPPYAAGTPCFVAAGGPGGLSTARPNTTIGSDNFRNTGFTSNYNAFNVTLRKRFSNGLQFNANYTYAKALDELSDAFRTNIGAVSTGPTDPMNLKEDYGPADFDVKHRIVFSPTYDLPFMKGNRWLGGWSVNSIISWQTGAPIYLYNSGGDENGSGVANQRPAFIGTSLSGAVNNNVSPAHGFLNAADFAPVDQASGVGCSPTVNQGIWCNSNLRRGAIYGPHFANVDFGVGKGFKINERSKLTFEANFFDLFNHPNFSTPDGNVLDANFGRSLATFTNAGGHRVSQLALRFDF
ncbi:MAG TPA: TonB-dependent receptor [Terriglobales bacterium]|nr:TonB-dependent receptor [Terriglobales bacterium]